MIDTTTLDVRRGLSGRRVDRAIDTASSGGRDSGGDEWVVAMGARKRAWIVTLVACVAVAALASCGADAERSETTGEVTASGDVGAFDVRVGDCLSEVPGGSVFATQVETVPAVPCQEEHAGEVYDSFDLEDAEFPGDERTAILAQEGCAERFGSFVGLSYGLARFEISVLTPSSETWDIGDHEVVCIVSDPSGPLTDSPRGLGRAAAPAVGSCWEALGTQVDCAVAHDAEIYALVDLPDGVWPGQKTLDADSELACRDKFGVYVGLAYDRSALDFAFVTPVEASWSAGDRLVGCLVVDPDAPLTGSVRGSGR